MHFGATSKMITVLHKYIVPLPITATAGDTHLTTVIALKGLG